MVSWTEPASGGIYDLASDTWSPINMDGPSLRISHFLVYGDGYVYVGRGGAEDTNPKLGSPIPYFYDLWRYSLAEGAWEEIELPSNIAARDAVWVDDALYLFGECSYGARLDPVTLEWTKLSTEGAPPQYRLLEAGAGYFSVGGQIAAHGIAINDLESFRGLWWFDPEG